MAKDCTSPCKICKGDKGQHPYYNCPNYKPRDITTTNIKPTSAMFVAVPEIEEIFSTKRQANFSEDQSKKIRVQDLLNKSEVNPIKELELIKSEVIKPKPRKRIIQTTTFIAKEPIEVKSIVNATNINVSLAQLADLSPAFRSELKRTITKSNIKHRKVREKSVCMPTHQIMVLLAQLHKYETLRQQLFSMVDQ